MRIIQTIILTSVALLAACSSPMGERMGQSVSVMRAFQAGDHPIPSSVFEGAKGIAILREGSGAFIIGGAGGSGVYLQRSGLGWSAPVAIDTAALSIGLQAGFQSRDIVIVFNTEDEVRSFLDDGVFALAEAAAVAGPSSDDKNAGGPAPSSYYYIRADGLFSGLLVGGVVFSTNTDVDEESYGRGVSLDDIVSGKVGKPAGQQVLEQTLR